MKKIKKVISFECPYCEILFNSEHATRLHINQCSKNLELPWKYLRILKKYRNGQSLYFAKFLNRRFTESFMDEVAEYVGENTDGGHNTWIDVSVTKVRGLPKMRQKPCKITGFEGKMTDVYTILSLRKTLGDY